MDPEPLTAPAIHRALAALDAGQLPDVATIRAALLLALTVGPLLVERRNLRAALRDIETARESASAAFSSWVGDTMADRKTAWAWLILYGADAGMVREAAIKHRYASEDTTRLQQYCSVWRRAQALLEEDWGDG